MFVGASVAFFLTLLLTFLVLEVTPILAVLVLSLTFSMIGMCIGLTVNASSGDFNDDYDKVRRSVAIASGAFALLTVWVGVWAAMIPVMTSRFGTKPKSMWIAFACGISVWVVGMIIVFTVYASNVTFRNYVNGHQNTKKIEIGQNEQ